MSNIKIENIDSVSSQLCLDHDSFLVNLTEKEVAITSGGIFGVLAAAAGVYGVAYAIGRDARRKREHAKGNVCYS